MAREWSDQQKAIFNWFQFGSGHMEVLARAGTGKTTTILEGIEYAPENKILLCAFNKKIAQELTSKLRNPRAEAKTLHGVGFAFVRNNWRGVRVDDARGFNLARQVGKEYLLASGDRYSETPDQVATLIKNLASKVKGMAPFPEPYQVNEIATAFDLLPDEEMEEKGWTIELIVKLTIKAMAKACEQDGTLDFDDMIFVPVANGWVRGQYDLVVVDEAQDMNASQLLLARGACKPSGRIVIVGDDRQAIYAFRGADSDAMGRMQRELKAQVLGLTITYRCPKSIVALAQEIVQDYQAAPTAPEGIISSCTDEKLFDLANPGDFVVSRKNAPLARICLGFLKRGKRAKVQGKDIGKGLATLVKKLKAKSIPDFLEKLNGWQERELKRLAIKGTPASESRSEVIVDQAECLRALCEGTSGLRELETRLNDLFVEVEDAQNSFIVCSSVHRVKGLEADRVFILEWTLMSGKVEEDNIRYVAITRAKRELTWVEEA